LPDRAIFGINAGVYHMEAFTALRSASPVTLGFGDLPGLATCC
jgi:hypothetical protein